jgi:hypothetical protein
MKNCKSTIASQQLQVNNCKSRIASQELQKKSILDSLNRLKVFSRGGLMNERTQFFKNYFNLQTERVISGWIFVDATSLNTSKLWGSGERQR